MLSNLKSLIDIFKCDAARMRQKKIKTEINWFKLK